MIREVERLKKEVVDFTQKIIRIPSFTGQEEELAGVILEKLREFNLDDAFIDEIGNVVGVIRGNTENNGPSILLNGHLDIVPAGNLENWNEYDPFGAEIDGKGNIHGRGAADLKGGISVQLYTMKLLKLIKDRGYDFNGNIIFSAVVHEEAAEMFGMEYLCRNTLPSKKLGFDVVFLCEPTSLNVMLGQRGKVEIIVTTKGKTAHSSVPEEGINALEKMLPVLDNIFNKMNNKLKVHKLLGKESITVTNAVCKPGALSIIPDICEISVDRRYMPEMEIEDLLDQFKEIFSNAKKKDQDFNAMAYVRECVEKSYTGYEGKVKKYHPPWITDVNNIYVQKTINALKKIGHIPEIGYWKFGTDGSMTGGIMDIPTIGYSGMEERFAHTPEEMVNIEMMIKSFEGYFSIMCGLLDLDINDLSF